MAEIPPALARRGTDARQVSRELRSAERREAVLARMTAVFAKRGYQAATVDHLIAGGKISMGNFYKEFDAKEDCFLAVYDRVIGRLKERFGASVEGAGEWPEQVAVALRSLVGFAAEDPMAARVVLLEAQTGGAAALARHAGTLAEASAFLRRGREAGDTAGELPESFEDATVSGLLWLLQNRLAKGRIEDPDELWPNMAKMTLEPYVGAGRADQALRTIA